MAIIQYSDREYTPTREKALKDLSSYSTVTKGVLTALGDYWTEYYRNFDALKWAASGSVAAVSREYDKLLQYVMSSNIVDIPAEQSLHFDLLVFHENDVVTERDSYGEVTSYFVKVSGLSGITYLTTSLFESKVILENGIHYEIISGKGIRFYVDIFNDPSIVKYAYTMDDESIKSVLLWGGSIAFQSTLIYEKFGRFLYKKAVDSEHYKWVVEALMHYYTNAKTPKNIQNVLNIIYGVPYTRYNNETIEEISYTDYYLNDVSRPDEAPYIRITTDKNTYYTYAFSTINVKIGDTVPQYTLLSGFNKVTDYVDTPKWWENIKEPIVLTIGDSRNLTKDEENLLMDKVMKYNIVYFKLGISYETYDTYLSQINEIMKIIKTGFPVYLYPFIQTIFYVVFLDTLEANVDFIEALKNLLVELQFETKYSYGMSESFDGSITYYMDPCTSHGSLSEVEEKLYDGKFIYFSYGQENQHRPVITAIAYYDGEREYDDTCFSKNHGSDVENLKTEASITLPPDIFDWHGENKRILSIPGYSGERKHDGLKGYGSEITYEESDLLRIRYTEILSDALKSYIDSIDRISAKLQIESDEIYLPEGKFSGKILYSGNSGHDSDSYSEEGSDNVLLEILPENDNYTWTIPGQLEQLYIGDCPHNGTSLFGGGARTEEGLDGLFNRQGKYELFETASKLFLEEKGAFPSLKTIETIKVSLLDSASDQDVCYTGDLYYNGLKCHSFLPYVSDDITITVKSKLEYTLPIGESFEDQFPS